MNTELTLSDNVRDLVEFKLDESNKIKNIRADVLREALVNYTLFAGVVRGQKIGKELCGVMVEALASQILANRKLREMTLPDLERGIRCGAFGEFGEVYGVNAGTIYQMLLRYRESAEYQEILRAVQNARDKRKYNNR